jgi:hypothetical protein
MNRINQKGTRPQDEPVLLAELPTGDREFIRWRLTPIGSPESQR